MARPKKTKVTGSSLLQELLESWHAEFLAIKAKGASATPADRAREREIWKDVLGLEEVRTMALVRALPKELSNEAFLDVIAEINGTAAPKETE